MSVQYNLFTYVNNSDIESFLENKATYSDQIAFLGDTGEIVTKNNIYGANRQKIEAIENSYVSKSYFSSYMTKIYNDLVENEEIIAHSLNSMHEEISYCVSLEYLDSQGYITASDLGNLDGFVSYEYLESQGYITVNDLGNLDRFVTYEYLDSQSYAGYSYVYDAYSYIMNQIVNNELIVSTSLNDLDSRIINLENNQSGDLDLSAYVTKSDLEAQSYLQSVPDNYVTYAHLDSVSYVSQTQLQQAAYITSTDLSAQSYAGYSYVYAAYNYIMGQMIDNELVVAYVLTDIDNRLNNLDIDVDLSAYVSKSELEAQSYLQSVPDNYVTYAHLDSVSYVSQTQLQQAAYITSTDLSAQSYAGYSYVYAAYSYMLNAIYDNEYVTAYALIQLNDKLLNVNEYIDFSPYVPKTWMNTYAKNATLNTYAKKTDLASYVKITDLSAQGYLTSHQDLTNYATKPYAIENFTSYAYIEERLSDVDVDLSAYVSKTELTTQSYITSGFASSNYPTYTYFEQRLENIDFANYVSKTELDNQSYASTTYVENAYSYVLEKIAVLELSTGGGGSGTSAEGGITSIVFNGSPASITGSVATINNPVYDSTITIRMNNSTVDTFTLNAQTAKTIDIGNVTVPSDLNDYVSKTELSNAGYITSGLPSVTSNDNGKVLMVVNGAWALVSPSTIYSGNATPSNANGNNGDIYLQS